jgi:thymidine phosphorylase
MNEVLGLTAGNAIEVAEAVDYLTGKHREHRLHEITKALVSQMLVLGKLAATPEEGALKAQAALDSGKAAEKFAAMVAALGGPYDFLDRPEHYLATAPVTVAFEAPRSGFIAAEQTRAIGLIVVDLGGGRRKTTDVVDMGVGLSGFLPIGTKVAAGDRLVTVHANTGADAAKACAALAEAITIADAAPPARPLVHARVI